MPTKEQRETIAQLEWEIPMLRRYARSLCRNADNADDLVQECLVRAIAKIETWKPGTNLKAWLIVILRNLFLNECRRAKRQRISLDELAVSDTPRSPARQEANLKIAEVENALMSLSADHREVLTLVVIQGMTYEQTAHILDVTMGTIKSRLWRARSRMIELLDGSDARTLNHSSSVRRAA